MNKLLLIFIGLTTVLFASCSKEEVEEVKSYKIEVKIFSKETGVITYQDSEKVDEITFDYIINEDDDSEDIKSEYSLVKTITYDNYIPKEGTYNFLSYRKMFYSSIFYAKLFVDGKLVAQDGISIDEVLSSNQFYHSEKSNKYIIQMSYQF